MVEFCPTKNQPNTRPLETQGSYGMIGFNLNKSNKDTGMQTTISHLPREKQQELEQIAEIIEALDGVEMIILFGSYARGDWREEKELEPNRWSGHASDYDILVVVKEPTDASFERVVREAANAPRFSAHVNPIVHDIEDINNQLSEGRYFFVDIKREGRLLYDSEAFSLAEPRVLTHDELGRIAQADFDYWYERSTGFYQISEFCNEQGKLPLTMFNLNQATESAYKAILLVFTGYCPHEHLLELLGAECETFGPVFRDIFPNDTKKEKDRFILLDRAYIGARYIKDFIVFWRDVEYLAPRVKQILETTEAICLQKIEALGNEN
jgi:predicted nucleotidyltransferase/HEPN domain-containing protein